MNNKILPLLVCLLFFVPIFSVIGAPIQIRNEEIPSDDYIEDGPIEKKYGNIRDLIVEQAFSPISKLKDKIKVP